MTNKNLTEVEICCADIESLYEAAKGGAQRVELCSALSEGGVTPYYSMIITAAALGFSSINVLIRPRMGDFVYSKEEIAGMIVDIKIAKSLGATGIVSGALLPDGTVDVENTKKLMEAAQGLEFIFHRAFDMTANPTEALNCLINLGCNRLLTSGCCENAFIGIPMLYRLVALAEGRIAIMAGSGINPQNVEDIIRKTGVNAVHASAKSIVSSRMTFRNKRANIGTEGTDEYARLLTSCDIVSQLLSKVSSI